MLNKLMNNKIFRFYKPILIGLVICGYDYRFYNDVFYMQVIVKTYCVSLISIVIYASISCCPSDMSQMWSLIEYVFSIIVSLFSKSQTDIYLHKLIDIDAYLRINKRHYNYTRYKVVIFTLTTWLVRIAYSFMYCHTYPCYNILIFFAIRQWSLLALDLNRVWRCIIFDSIRYRLKILRMRLEEHPHYKYYLYVNNFKSIKENKMKFCHHIYRSIADLVDLISPELHASLFISVAGSLPKLISNVYHVLAALEGREPMISLGYIILHVIQISLLLFSPFVVVEFYSVEVERIRLFLMHKYIDHKDFEDKADIEMFLRYTQLRTFKYRIFRIIPINLSLPLELINICVSYVVILINFTHLYG